MNIETILSSLNKNHDAFIEYMQSLSEDEFMFSLNGEKWTAGQEMQHIIRSVNKLSSALQVPKFVIKMKFGVANRPSRTYEALVDKYTSGLEKLGGSFKLELDPVAYSTQNARVDKLRTGVKRLSRLARKYSEKDLDYYILPHPLMGKLTIRELLYFTIHHVQHHKLNSIRNLKEFREARYCM